MEEGAEAAPDPPPAEHKREQEDEDEEALRVAKRRKVLCSEFSAITNSDGAVALRFLAGSDWHMERALNAYFDPPREMEAAVGGTAPAGADTGSCIDLTADATTSNAGVSSAESQQNEDDSKFSLITWNIDGLDVGSVKDRARGICTYLALYSPDVVFLQEVIPLHLPLLQMKAANYTIIPGDIDEYFTVIMLKKSRVKLLKHEIIPFPTTAMKRNLSVVHVSICGIELCLMTSHLESTKNHSKERIKQLQIVLKEMQKESESTTVIFGGDTNLRDSEVTKLGNLPDKIKDVWEFLGKPQHCRYTWDTQSNTNLNAPYKCKMRFDRVYFRPAVEGGQFIPRSMDLIGDTDEYFTVIMLKKSRVKLLKHEIIPFPTTAMKRNLSVVHVSICGIELCLMTSHLESTKIHSKERIKQLQIVLKEMQKESESTTVIFGGDTNLRDSERALNAYFDPPREMEAAVGGTAPAGADTGSCTDLTADATTSNAGVSSAESQQNEDDSKFSLITWNIDGLHLENVKDRARGICTYLALYSPDVVFLQEVISPHFPLLQMEAANYTIIPGDTDGYFTAIMLKKSRVKLLKHEIIPFPTTTMMRNLLVVHVSICGIELCLMTSHLESTRSRSEERIKQLQIVLKEMQKESGSTTVIFGGDTNLRDSEVTKLGGLPGNIKDVWEFLGKPQHCRYTWDTQSNTNLNAPYKCKMRFDRVYFRPAVEGGRVIPRRMDLIGLKKLECGSFPSDHWGILCNFDVIL